MWYQRRSRQSRSRRRNSEVSDSSWSANARAREQVRRPRTDADPAICRLVVLGQLGLGDRLGHPHAGLARNGELEGPPRRHDSTPRAVGPRRDTRAAAAAATAGPQRASRQKATNKRAGQPTLLLLLLLEAPPPPGAPGGSSASAARAATYTPTGASPKTLRLCAQRGGLRRKKKRKKKRKKNQKLWELWPGGG